MIFASNNNGKLEEIKSILNDYDIFSMNDYKINIDIVEDKDTFLENAKKKAYVIYKFSHKESLADDSGLMINSLNGFPGVLTHRFLGDNASDTDRNNYLIEEVNKHKDRTAKVVCSLAYYDGNGFITASGSIDGIISKERRGDNGFGFDEIFELPDGRTLAEISKKEKNEISARKKACELLKKKIKLKMYDD
jgi:XTP/dITP diphosphohydrolase